MPQLGPLCYASRESRFSILPGKWKRDWTHRPAYSNLSCPLEWSKYSCSHQGLPQHAAAAASHRFEPAGGCHLLTLSEDVHRRFIPSRRRIWMVGDSLMRQLLISIGCALGRAVTTTHVSWKKNGMQAIPFMPANSPGAYGVPMRPIWTRWGQNTL